MRRVAVAKFWCVALVLGGRCATGGSLALSPPALRAEVRRRAPDLSPVEVVVPFEVDAASVARAREIVARADSDAQRARLLAAALFGASGFGLRYSPIAATASAEETLRRGEGNCLGLASVFVGLARGVGLTTFYVDASRRVRHVRESSGDLTVNEGHVTAMVETREGPVTLDFDRDGVARTYRAIGDLEALAHFYNNRGFERVDVDGARARPDWVAAARDFRRAVRVEPAFARAWNNLGIAAARTGRDDDAIRHYRRAIVADPRLAAPHNNLGLVLLRRGDVAGALGAFETAAALDARAYDVQYHLALARLRAGDAPGARAAVLRALALRSDYPDAQALLGILERR